MAKYLQWCGQKYIGGDDAPIGFGRVASGKYQTDPVHGVVYELEKRRANLRDECPDTGWYLYGGSHFGTWCARTILEAVDVANTYILK